MKERDYKFDNIKGIMLILVALGHVLDVYCGADHHLFEYSAMKYMYLFHMPMFAFVTGYFTKNTEKARKNAVRKALIPYLILQSVYLVTAAIMIRLHLATFNANVFNYSLILPSSAFYYLLATFFWKLFAEDLKKLRYPVLVSFLLGIGISFTASSEFHVGYGAVFSLLFFFTLGMVCTEKHVAMIRRLPKLASVGILLAAIIPAVYFPYAIHSIRLNYTDEGFGLLEGALWRVVFYAIAVLICVAIINLITDKKTILSRIGEHALLVYAGSTFLSPSLYVLMDRFLKISANRALNFAGMVLFSVAVAIFMSSAWITKLYNFFERIVLRILFKNEKKNASKPGQNTEKEIAVMEEKNAEIRKLHLMLQNAKQHAAGGKYEGSELVSIIMLNRNGLDHLKVLMPSLKASDYYQNIELIVIDNASTDASLEYLEQYKDLCPIRIIQNKENQSFSEANNRGAKLAKGDYLLFLNNDTEVTDGWLDAMMAAAMLPKAGAVGAKLVYPAQKDPKKTKYSYTIQHRGIAFRSVVREEMDFMQPYNMGKHAEDIDLKPTVQERAAVTAAALLVSKEAFTAVGGFDEAYIYGYEDVDLSLKLKKAGYKNYYCPGAVLYHYEFGTQNKDVPEEVKARRHSNFLHFREKWQEYLTEKAEEEKRTGIGLFTEIPDQN